MLSNSLVPFFYSAVPKTTHRTEGESTAEQSGAMPSFDRPFPEAEDAFPPPVLPGRRLRAPVAPAALPGPAMAAPAALPGSKMAAAAGGTSRGRERAAQPRWWRREAAGRRLLLPSARPGPGMEVEKMDENEWKYHGEGNQSLVVSHCQVRGSPEAGPREGGGPARAAARPRRPPSLLSFPEEFSVPGRSGPSRGEDERAFPRVLRHCQQGWEGERPIAGQLPPGDGSCGEKC